MIAIDLATAVERGPVLTVNRRLSAWLVEEYDRLMASTGALAWDRPEILPFGAWLTSHLSPLGLETRVLSAAQHRILWEQVIAEDCAGLQRGLVGIASCARLALEAQKLLADFCCDIDSARGSEDVQAFLRWRVDWERRAREGNWLGPHQAPGLILEGFRSGRLPVPGGLTLAGFDTIDPVIQELLAALEGHGCTVARLDLTGPQSQPHVLPADDPNDEANRCAIWVRQCLERNPDARIGIVVPRLDEYRSLLVEHLAAELDPAGCLDPGRTLPVNFSLGTSLADEGAVYLALALFAFGQQVEIDRVGLLLRSPFLRGGQGEVSYRAALDRILRGKAQRADSWSRFSRLLRSENPTENLTTILDALDHWVDLKGRHLPGSWAERMANMLERVGWPGDSIPDRRSWQAVQHLLELLQQFASLDRLGMPLSRSEAVSHLTRLARETEFQVDRTESRVQVLGLLESAGLRFDHLWIMGLTDQALPAPAAPNPFIPLALQVQHRMPHADADREFRFASTSWQRLLGCAGSVVASWPMSVEGAETRPSPFLAGLPALKPDYMASVRPHAAIAAVNCCERLDDTAGNPLPPGRPFSGGTSLLKDQALCPFRAYLHQRLRAECLNEAEVGIDAMGRGNLVHLLLQYFWERMKTRGRLGAQTPETLASLLEELADRAIDSWQKRERVDLPARQRRVEQQRLVRTGLAWIERELERPGFEVLAMEEQQEVVVGDLRLRVRADRIDLLEDGSRLVIDYKTGKPELDAWFDERVTEPQLPLYSLQISADRFAGAFFARVHCRRSDCDYLGVIRPEHAWDERRLARQEKKLAEMGHGSFQGLLEHWRSTLEGIANEFANGHAAVDPVDPDKSCRYCDGLPVCRLLEKLAQVETP
ncbi:MAG: PD-(D/E)XK nuclease family protein [Geothermobacteraceae bacterium]